MRRPLVNKNVVLISTKQLKRYPLCVVLEQLCLSLLLSLCCHRYRWLAWWWHHWFCYFVSANDTTTRRPSSLHHSPFPLSTEKQSKPIRRICFYRRESLVPWNQKLFVNKCNTISWPYKKYNTCSAVIYKHLINIYVFCRMSVFTVWEQSGDNIVVVVIHIQNAFFARYQQYDTTTTTTLSEEWTIKTSTDATVAAVQQRSTSQPQNCKFALKRVGNSSKYITLKQFCTACIAQLCVYKNRIENFSNNYHPHPTNKLRTSALCMWFRRAYFISFIIVFLPPIFVRLIKCWPNSTPPL